MKSASFRVAISVLYTALLVSGTRAIALDRAPEILELRQSGDQMRVLWAPGGDADGTLDEDVIQYKLQRQGLGPTTWTTIFTSDEKTMIHVDDVSTSGTWTTYKGDLLRYRVEASTSSGTTLSVEKNLVPSLPVWSDESRDGKARLAWVPSPTPIGYPIFVGYRVQRFDSGSASWTNLTGWLPDLSYIDPNTTTGTSRYRVQSRHQKAPPSSGTSTRTSNEVQITIHSMCDGQSANPYPLTVIDIVDQDADGYDGDDIAAALGACAEEAYEDLSLAGGDDDGVWEPDNGESPIFGGCILRALPVTYDDVAIRITDRTQCDASPTAPLHCLPLNYPAGLVIEGHGRETVFRAPLWQSLGTPVPLPASVLEVHRRDFQLTLRNLVLDGRKFEQEPPGTGNWAGWWYGGLYVWNTGPWLDQVREIAGDSIGDEDGYCDPERCLEAASGNDGDGQCEPGESCVEHPDDVGVDANTVCSTDRWTTAPGCESTKDADDGCLHNVEVRDIPGAHAVLIDHANRWIIEDNDIHDVGCVNRGYGYDCLHFESAADATVPPGFKTFGIGLNVNAYTADFQVRRNQVYRTTKYGLSFDNDKGTCNGLLRNHEVSDNHVHDIGAVGIFNHGSVGARIHDNTIERMTTWNDPPELNGNEGPFAMSLGGYCSDDNQFSDNVMTDSGGIAILWHGSTETVTCSSPSSCTLAAAQGNTIAGNTIDGSCLEKVTAAGAPYSFGMGSIHFGWAAGGTMHLTNNTLTDSQCRFAISAYGQAAWIQPFDLRISGGSYESGPNAATRTQGGFYCGALHLHGSNRKFVVGDDTSIVNITTNTVPKASVGYGATLVIDDTPDDPFADGPYTGPEDVGGTGGPVTIVECSQSSHPDCD